MVTFTQTFTLPESSVKGFAEYIGWQEKLTRQKIVVDDDTTTPETTHFEIEEYDNPQTFAEFVDEKAKAHSLSFTKSWAETLKQQEIDRQVQELKDTIEPTLQAQIVQPVEDALTSEIISE